MRPEPRIVSLVPAATDWVVALGLADRLVGVTHECDVPAGAPARVVVRPAVASDPADPAGVDAAVTRAASQQRPLYEVDEAAVTDLAPTVVLTQALCDVCAVPASAVDRLASSPPRPEVVTLDGVTLEGVLADATRLGAALGADATARTVVGSLRDRLQRVADAVAGRRPVPLGVVEWPDPPYLPGHWVPDQVAAAGATCVAGTSGQPSRRGEWRELAGAEALVVAPCGYGLGDAVAHGAPAVPAWLAADVWAADAGRAFSRPSAGLLDGVEALAAIAHPDAVGGPDPALARRVRTGRAALT